jgi:hypothetical protein
MEDVNLLVSDRPTFLGEPTAWVKGTLVDLGNGKSGLRLANNRWRSVLPQGTYEERDAAQGPYEWFTLDADVNVVRVTPRYVTFAIPVREA